MLRCTYQLVFVLCLKVFQNDRVIDSEHPCFLECRTMERHRQGTRGEEFDYPPMDPGFSPSPHPPPWLEPPPPYEVAIKTTCSSTRLRRAYSDTHLATEPLFGQSREISFEVWCWTMGMPRHSVHHTLWYSTRVGFLLRLCDDCLLTATHFIILEACVCYSRHQVKEIVQNSGLLLSFLAERFRRRIVCQVCQNVSVRSPKTFIISKKDVAPTEWPRIHGHSIGAASFFHWCASHKHWYEYC